MSGVGGAVMAPPERVRMGARPDAGRLGRSGVNTWRRGVARARSPHAIRRRVEVVPLDVAPATAGGPRPIACWSPGGARAVACNQTQDRRPAPPSGFHASRSRPWERLQAMRPGAQNPGRSRPPVLTPAELRQEFCRWRVHEGGWSPSPSDRASLARPSARRGAFAPAAIAAASCPPTQRFGESCRRLNGPQALLGSVWRRSGSRRAAGSPPTRRDDLGRLCPHPTRRAGRDL
jgi:hypothetical protein